MRHAWKQWKSVCDDTGQRDFTLRRRGTKDYTSSIKKGQYSHANKYSTGLNKNSSTTGSNSPNYSGSVFGDSAIEEDISCDKYPNQLEYSHDNRSRKSSTNTNYKRQVSDASSHRDQRPYVYQHNSNYHSQKIPIRVPSARRDQNTYTSRIEIMPQETPFQPSTFLGKNPLSHLDVNSQFMASTPYTDKYGNHHQQYQQQDYIPRGNLINNIHIESSEGSGSISTKTTNTTNTEPYSWRKFAGPRSTADEFSTEL